MYFKITNKIEVTDDHIFLFPSTGELTSIIQRSALDYKASPSVLRECKHSIEMCKRQTGDFDGSMDDFEDGGIIEGTTSLILL